MRPFLGVTVTSLALILSGLAGPAQAAPTTVALVGDMACATDDPAFNDGAGTGELCRQRSVSDLVTPSRVAKVFALGDLQYERGEYEQFTRSYAPSFGRAKSKTYPVCGNHEYGTPGAAGYQRYFGRTCRWYSTLVGGARFVMLDTNQSMAVGSPQYEFVRTALDNTGARCLFLVGHHPRYSVAEHGDNAALDAIWDLAVSRGVTAMFSGHDHAAMRSAPRDASGAVVSAARGMTQIVSGGGGHNVEAAVTSHPGVRVYLRKVGVYEMDLDAASVTVRFRSRFGNVLDTATLPCRR